MVRSAVNKTALAQSLGISRSSLYYQPKREKIDEEVKAQIESVMGDHPDYGHKRIAIHLKLNKKENQTGDEEIWIEAVPEESKEAGKEKRSRETGSYL